MTRRHDIWTPDLPLTGLGGEIKIFLAGPVKGAPRWQEEVPPLPGVTWISPRWRKDDFRPFDIKIQVEWETTGLRISDMIVFWIPAPVVNIPGRSYAQTTRTEFGEWAERGKTLIAGMYTEFPGRGYLKTRYPEVNIHETWDEVLEEIMRRVEERKIPKTFFTSDTHFGSSRALMYSQRPFKDVPEMDWTIIERWNSTVSPWDTVYHLGDFGETWPLGYLNGNIKILPGNYERKEDTIFPEGIEILPGPVYTTPGGYRISHEPSGVKDLPGGHKLFGHIHGRCKVKPWGGVDVGVDSWGFRPVSSEEVRFLLAAIPKYDSEVWD